MISVRRGTMLRPAQIRLNELITVERVTSSRGFEYSDEGCGLDTLLPKDTWEGIEADTIFDVFDDPNARATLLKQVLRPSAQQPYALSRFLALNGVILDRQRFSTTFEWYVGELLVRKFKALSSSYGVSIDNLLRPMHGGATGDYDVLSILGDTSLLYMECKTGGRSRDEIVRMADRGRALHTSLAIMLLHKHFTSKSLKSQLNFTHPNLKRNVDLVEVSIPNNPKSIVYKWGDLFFVNAGPQGGCLEAKLRTILRLNAASRVELNRDLGLNDDLCRACGYNVTAIA